MGWQVHVTVQAPPWVPSGLRLLPAGMPDVPGGPGARREAQDLSLGRLWLPACTQGKGESEGWGPANVKSTRARRERGTPLNKQYA